MSQAKNRNKKVGFWNWWTVVLVLAALPLLYFGPISLSGAIGKQNQANRVVEGTVSTTLSESNDDDTFSVVEVNDIRTGSPTKIAVPPEAYSQIKTGDYIRAEIENTEYLKDFQVYDSATKRLILRVNNHSDEEDQVSNGVLWTIGFGLVLAILIGQFIRVRMMQTSGAPNLKGSRPVSPVHPPAGSAYRLGGRGMNVPVLPSYTSKLDQPLPPGDQSWPTAPGPR